MSSIVPLQLILSYGIGDVFIRKFADFVQQENDGEMILHSCEKLQTIFGLNLNKAQSIVFAEREAKLLANQLRNRQIEWTWIADERYPHRLKSVLGKDAPPILFFQGNLGLCEEYSVGFCGSRGATDRGISVAKKCSEQLVSNGIVVVSGYAKGVDLAAHQSALINNGKTIFVLAEGIFHFREKLEIKGLLAPDTHLVVSQFSPNLSWIARNAMRRNSTIIGLSDAMVLVESGLKGGTFAAGEECLNRNRPLFVVDFASPPGPSAQANPEFIRRGGKPIRGNQAGMPNLNYLLDTVYHSSFVKNESLF